MKKLRCSIGVIVYNEAKNIGILLERIIEERYPDVDISEIIVVSSASTDGTDEIVSGYAQIDKRIKLIRESKRNGKSSAINLFIEASTTQLLIVESGDTIPEKNTIRKLILPFKDERIGMTGGRPQPVNNSKTLAGYAVNLMWKLHHKMALISPKLGEMIAFRKVFPFIPKESAVDEASIEAEINKHGLKKKYVANARIINKGPDDIEGFITQRRRIEAGHLWLMKNNHYKVISQDKTVLLNLLKEELLENPQDIFKVFAVMSVELYSRILGMYDFYIKKKNPFTWEIVKSTKDLGIKDSQ